MKIKAVIIDDEKDVRYLLRNIIEKNFSSAIEIVGEADDVFPGVKLISEQQPDLVFLDIKMKKGSGFDLLKKIDKINFEVIFITAYDQFAVKAFKFSAFGYLMKPIKVGDLKEVVVKLKDHLQQLKIGAEKRVKVLIDNYGDDEGCKRICISNIEGFNVLEIVDIVRLESENNYTHFILSEGKKMITSRTIKDYEDLLADHGFYRVHQRHIINLRHVKTYLKGDGGSVLLSDGSELPVARQRKPGFVRRFI